MADDPETLVKQRIAQIEAICERRSALLLEMYHLLKKRENVGTVLDFDDGEEGDLHVFLNKFQMKTDPPHNYFNSIPENELFSLVPAEAKIQSPSSSRSSSVANVESVLRSRSASLKSFPQPAVHEESPRSPVIPPQVESDDELDIIGPSLPVSTYNSPPPSTHSDGIEISSVPEGDQALIVGGDDQDNEVVEDIQVIAQRVSPIPESDPNIMEETIEVRAPSAEVVSEDEERRSPTAEIQVEVQVEAEAVLPVVTDEHDTLQEALSHEDNMDVDHDEELPAPKESTPPTLNDTQTDGGIFQQEPAAADFEDDMVVDETIEDTPIPGEQPPIIRSPTTGPPTTPPSTTGPLTIVPPTTPPLITGPLPIVPPTTPSEPLTVAPLTTGSPTTPPVPPTTSPVPPTTSPVPPTTSPVSPATPSSTTSPPTIAPPTTGPPPAVPEPTIRPKDLFVMPIDLDPEPIIEHPPPPPVFVPIPSFSYHSWDGVQFPADFTAEKEQAPPSSPNQVRFNVETAYPLPPIKSLPIEFNPNKKGKYVKQKRKEREKAEKAGGQMNKEEWTPWGFNRWIITIKTNPLYKRVSKSTKCLTTRDWSIAMNELRLLRTAERVEYLKAKGRWSFRQPKKQRGVGGSTKTHWDYLLEEMKWMRTDFREERKWKMALAYNLSTAVLEWHAASSLEERVKKGICVLWKPPRRDTRSADDSGDAEMVPICQESENENTDTQPSPEKSIVDYGSDDEEEDDQDKDHQSVVDALDTAAILEESLAFQEHGLGEYVGLKDLEPKKEEIEDPHALEDNSMAVDSIGLSGSQQTVQKTETPSGSASFGLKSTSNDPVLGSKSNTHSSEPANHQSKSHKRNMYAPIREQVAYSEIDKLFLDLDDFHISSSDPHEDVLSQLILPTTDVSDIFPDMQPYGLLDIHPPIIPEGKKRSDKKSEQDPNKRIDETERTKLLPTSRFMYMKPTLIGALDPIHHFKDGQWLPFDDTPITVDYEGPPMRAFNEEFANKLFENKPVPIQIVTPAVPSPINPQSPVKDKAKEKRSIDHLWTANDDALLKSLIDKYPNNWDLVAECYNATRKVVSTDIRTSRDCQERWRQLWEQEQGRQRLESDGQSPSSSSGTTMTTRGVKRLASTSVSSTIAPAGSEPKKRRRHLLIHETIRKSVKKRAEAAQKANVKKPPVLHDTHIAYNKLPKLSPAELSRMKVESELRQTQEMQLRNRLNGQQVRPPAGQQVPQPVAVAGATPAVSRPATAAAPVIPNQNVVVPAIRSQQAQVPISQQQRAATPLIATQARMAPQQQQQQQHQQQLLQQAQQARPQQAQTQQQQQHLALSQQQALAAALAQVQAQNAASAAAAAAANGGSMATAAPIVNGTSGGVAQNPHLPPAYNAVAVAAASRDSTSSPAHTSPPPSRTSATPVSVNSAPTQPQTQSVQQPQQNGSIGAMGIPRSTNMQGHYYLQNVATYSPEQIQMLMMQMYQHQQHQQQQHQQQQQQHQQQQQQQQPGQQTNAGFNNNAQT